MGFPETFNAGWDVCKLGETAEIRSTWEFPKIGDPNIVP